jgi:hypothetical protein
VFDVEFDEKNSLKEDMTCYMCAPNYGTRITIEQTKNYGETKRKGITIVLNAKTSGIQRNT